MADNEPGFSFQGITATYGVGVGVGIPGYGSASFNVGIFATGFGGPQNNAFGAFYTVGTDKGPDQPIGFDVPLSLPSKFDIGFSAGEQMGFMLGNRTNLEGPTYVLGGVFAIGGFSIT